MESFTEQTHLELTLPFLDHEVGSFTHPIHYQSEIDQLRQQNQYIHHIIEHLPAGIIILNISGYIIQANLQAKSMLGEPLAGEKWLDIIDTAFTPKADDGHAVSLSTGHKVKLSTTPLFANQGQMIIITDLTETLLLQERVAHLQRLSALGRMVASLAHQIRTPLAAAMLYAGQLNTPRLTPDTQNKFQQKLTARLDDLEQQVNNMLLFAKSDDNNVLTVISVHQLFSSIQSFCEVMLKQFDSQLLLTLPKQDIYLKANLTTLTSVFSNLVHNSLQAKKKKSTIQIQIAPSTQAQFVIFEIIDDGPGIDPIIQEQIFEPFFTTKSQGTGLGLAVVKAVIQAHDGQLSLQSSDQSGTQFNITLPINKTPTHS